MDTTHTQLNLRKPVSEDGLAVHRLIEKCPPLDTNSSYCNLLQCSHFAETSVAAESPEQLLGFISGYLVPERPSTLFIWQVAVDQKARGQKLASRMLQHILNRPSCREVDYLETTITRDNDASWALFKRLARQLGAEIECTIMFDQQTHFQGQHDTEHLVRIGPIGKSNATPSTDPDQ